MLNDTDALDRDATFKQVVKLVTLPEVEHLEKPEAEGPQLGAVQPALEREAVAYPEDDRFLVVPGTPLLFK